MEIDWYRRAFPSPWNDRDPRETGKRDAERRQIRDTFKNNLFSGDKKDYPEWKERQIQEIHYANLSIKDKIEETVNSLDGKNPTLATFRKVVDKTHVGYRDLLFELEQTFGGPEYTMQALKNALIDAGRIKFKSYDSLIQTSQRLKAYFQHCQAFGLTQVYLSRETEIDLLAAILTERDKELFYEYADRNDLNWSLNSLNMYCKRAAHLMKERGIIPTHKYDKLEKPPVPKTDTRFKPRTFVSNIPSWEDQDEQVQYSHEGREGVDETELDPNSEEYRAEYDRAQTLAAVAYEEENEPGEYTDEEFPDEEGRSVHLEYPAYSHMTLNTSHQCRMKCPSKHMLVLCPAWKNLTPEEKKDKIFLWKLCTNCFSSAHMSRGCPKSGACDQCKGPHHRSLHQCFIGNPFQRPWESQSKGKLRAPPRGAPPPPRASGPRGLSGASAPAKGPYAQRNA